MNRLTAVLSTVLTFAAIAMGIAAIWHVGYLDAKYAFMSIETLLVVIALNQRRPRGKVTDD